MLDLWNLVLISVQQADTQDRGYLDFADFKRFVKALKHRPEIDRLYYNVTASSAGSFMYDAFEAFMRDSQKVSAYSCLLMRQY